MAQLFVVLAGSGWVSGADGVRHVLREGQGAFIARGEIHAKRRLGLGLLAAGRWIWTMGTVGHGYDRLTWVVWLTLLLGPIVVGTYYLVQLLRNDTGSP